MMQLAANRQGSHGTSSPAAAAPGTIAELPHVDALDGLRGVAVSMVVFYHFWLALPRYEHPLSAGITRALSVFLIGQKGVDLFFVLSGFLITGILLRTRGSENYFSTFYIRRSLRIFPLYYLVVFGCLVAGLIWNLPQYNWRTMWWYLLYLQNVVSTFWPNVVDNSGPVHFWSLAVEEHYYLFWPFAVLLLSRAALVRVCILLIILPVGIRAWFEHMGLGVFTFTLCRIDTLAMGSLIAVIFQDPIQRATLVRLSRWCFLPVVLLSFGSFFVLSGSQMPLLPTFKYSLFAVLCSLTLVIALSPGRFNPAPRILSVPALRSLGRISYAIYVFHPFVLLWINRRLYDSQATPLHGKFYPSVIAELVIYLIVCVLLARVSWRVFEGPILRRKDRFRYRFTGDATLQRVAGA
jgi:peptidoglycan/LPS O-acetylase OafA/YrhL